jgi:hypothetical protein
LACCNPATDRTPSNKSMRPKLSGRIQDPKEYRSVAARRHRQVKNEISEDHRSARSMKKYDLVENRRTPKDVLLELPAP